MLAAMVALATLAAFDDPRYLWIGVPISALFRMLSALMSGGASSPLRTARPRHHCRALRRRGVHLRRAPRIGFAAHIFNLTSVRRLPRPTCWRWALGSARSVLRSGRGSITAMVTAFADHARALGCARQHRSGALAERLLHCSIGDRRPAHRHRLCGTAAQDAVRSIADRSPTEDRAARCFDLGKPHHGQTHHGEIRLRPPIENQKSLRPCRCLAPPALRRSSRPASLHRRTRRARR